MQKIYKRITKIHNVIHNNGNKLHIVKLGKKNLHPIVREQLKKLDTCKHSSVEENMKM